MIRLRASTSFRQHSLQQEMLATTEREEELQLLLRQHLPGAVTSLVTN